jgi:hypothetical protein
MNPADKSAEDAANLAQMLQLVRDAFPTAAHAHFETSDQNRYGFTLRAVTLADRSRVDSGDAFEALEDAAWDLIGDINWNGVMHESPQGYADVPVS